MGIQQRLGGYFVNGRAGGRLPCIKQGHAAPDCQVDNPEGSFTIAQLRQLWHQDAVNHVNNTVRCGDIRCKRWCDKGILAFEKTAGGHRRLSLPMILRFIQENRRELVHAEILDLPAAVGPGTRTLDQACQLYREALEQGDETRSLQIVFDMRMAGHTLAVIADRIVAPAFCLLGERWEHGAVHVYQERRGVEITRHVLQRLKDTLAPPDIEAPLAIGATLSHDPYTLVGIMGELVLLELGWKAQFLGSELPSATVAQAVRNLRPRALWLSISTIDNVDTFIDSYHKLYTVCLEHHCALVVGGDALTDSVRQSIQYAAYGDNLQHLCAFAQSLYRRT